MSEERRPKGSYGFGEVYLNFYFLLIKQSPKKKEGFNSSHATYDLLSLKLAIRGSDYVRGYMSLLAWVFVCFVFLLITGKPITSKASRYLFHSFHLSIMYARANSFPSFFFLLFDNVMQHVTNVVGSQVSASVITNSSAPQLFSAQPIVSSVLLD